MQLLAFVLLALSLALHSTNAVPLSEQRLNMLDDDDNNLGSVLASRQFKIPTSGAAADPSNAHAQRRQEILEELESLFDTKPNGTEGDSSVNARRDRNIKRTSFVRRQGSDTTNKVPSPPSLPSGVLPSPPAPPMPPAPPARRAGAPSLPLPVPSPPTAPSSAPKERHQVPSGVPPLPVLVPSSPAPSSSVQEEKRQLPAGLPVPVSSPTSSSSVQEERRQLPSGVPFLPVSAPAPPTSPSSVQEERRQLPSGVPILPVSAPAPPASPSSAPDERRQLHHLGSPPSPFTSSSSVQEERRQLPSGVPILPVSAPAPPTTPSSSPDERRQLHHLGSHASVDLSSVKPVIPKAPASSKRFTPDYSSSDPPSSVHQPSSKTATSASPAETEAPDSPDYPKKRDSHRSTVDEVEDIFRSKALLFEGGDDQGTVMSTATREAPLRTTKGLERK